MGCFPCAGKSSKNAKRTLKKRPGDQISSSSDKTKPNSALDVKKETCTKGGSENIAVHTFTFRELAAATKNFRQIVFWVKVVLAEYIKGDWKVPISCCVILLHPMASHLVVAIKQLDRNGLQGNREFLVEVLMLSLLHHPNLVNLIGYCADGDQRLLARPLFKDRRKFAQMADPLLQGQYPMRGLYQALAVAAMCVQEQPNMRPLIADVVTALTYLASQKYDPETPPVQAYRPGSSTPRIRREQ
ncbi:hypothetical protein GH714_009390 [Hevea brasiliensis]|uniref:Serine-threonine/tyrosine-protein kinase catalytic domain-containing protein n=1 Tax=Hevea brasiliensis TaxID=3981 RepID=A0A6A6N1U2_HEVBR|nr:hypothetical protein GH714_009390 [Hevea brasiliensis]